MKANAKRLASVLLALIFLAIALTGLGIWTGSRDTAPLNRAEIEQSYARSLAWFHANESTVRSDGNAALWWMVQAAAERMGDTYLLGLVREASATIYAAPRSAGLPWQRMVYPKVDVLMNLVAIEPLSPYQRFYYHGVTCLPVPLADGDTTRFLEENMCRPKPIKALWRDPPCSTHQLIGIQLYKRVGCPVIRDTTALEAELRSDIESQLRVDFVVKDAYLQRVLVLLWSGHADRVKPIWMRRIMSQQQADGGWTGERDIPELPSWMNNIRQKEAQPTGFHATAQGLLIAALWLTQDGHVGAAGKP